MTTRSYLTRFLAVTTFLLASLAQAIPMPPVPTEPIYFEPPIVQPTAEIRNQSCIDLDNAIRYLHPYRYSYKAEFHQDGYNKIATASIALESVMAILGLTYLSYSALLEEKEQRRTLQIEQQIAMLQQVKAEKHCFE